MSSPGPPGPPQVLSTGHCSKVSLRLELRPTTASTAFALARNPDTASSPVQASRTRRPFTDFAQCAGKLPVSLVPDSNHAAINSIEVEEEQPQLWFCNTSICQDGVGNACGRGYNRQVTARGGARTSQHLKTGHAMKPQSNGFNVSQAEKLCIG
jgi:hypothetical protein